MTFGFNRGSVSTTWQLHGDDPQKTVALFTLQADL